MLYHSRFLGASLFTHLSDDRSAWTGGIYRCRYTMFAMWLLGLGLSGVNEAPGRRLASQLRPARSAVANLIGTEILGPRLLVVNGRCAYTLRITIPYKQRIHILVGCMI